MGDEETTPADEAQPDAAAATQQDSSQQQGTTGTGQDDSGIQPDSLYHE